MTAIDISTKDDTVHFDSVEDFTKAADEAVARLSGTDYVKVAVSKINGEWLEKQPRLGDEITLHVVATVVETGKRLTDDGIQATAKLEVSGVTVVEE